MIIDFESKPTCGYDNKYVKTKIKKYADSVITNFRNKKMPKEKVPCKCLSVIMLDSVIESDEKYYPQRTILMKNQIVTLIMIMIMTNNLLKVFNTIK